MSGESSSDSDDELLEDVPRERFPEHIAIITDGNGRWAERRGQPRHQGHLEGARAVKRTVIEGARLRLGQLTFYSFSSENWNRPRHEVGLLMALYRSRLLAELDLMMDRDIRFRVIGDIDGLPAAVAREMRNAEQVTARNAGLVLCLALNYGGRDEILRAVRRLAEDVTAGTLSPEQIDAALLSERLDTAGMPDPDLMIRTAGEMRLSNFLLWQLSYAELHFTDVLWPDFAEPDLHAAIRAYASRQRRFGGLPGEAASPGDSPRGGRKGGGDAS